MPKQRLQKILAAAGIASRRHCEDLILEGAVRVNRKVVDTIPAFADPQNDLITVNGKKIRSAAKVYFLLNKPKGVICTNADPQRRKKAIDLIPSKQRIFCVGRLDIDTSGLIILTNDSELANKLTHPKYEVSKTYL
ncbi:MAG: pseudouridine synthase, partial [Planctomycetota bacterium]